MSSLTILLIGSVIWWVYQVGLNGGFTKMVDNMSDGIAETNTKTEELVSVKDIRAMLDKRLFEEKLEEYCKKNYKLRGWYSNYKATVRYEWNKAGGVPTYLMD